MLSNHEVLAHITAMKARYTAQYHQHQHQHQQGGGSQAMMKAENLETVLKEVCLPPPPPLFHSSGYHSND